MTITLNRLPIGQAAVVERVDTDVKISRRLRELGVFRGGTVEFVGAAPLGALGMDATYKRLLRRQ